MSNTSDETNSLYEFVHDGHCAAGWNEPTTLQKTVLDCRHECANRQNVGFFAYRSGDNCACYLSKDKCPDDDLHGDHNAYRIVNKGNCPIPSYRFIHYMIKMSSKSFALTSNVSY